MSVASAILPDIQYGTNGSNGTLSTSTITGVTWNGSNGGGTNSFWTLRTNGGSGDPVDIVLQFNNNGNGAGSLSDGVYTISQNGAIGPSNTNSPILKFSSTTNGIDMQGKTLTFDFLATDESGNANWNSVFDEANPKTRKMVLNLSGVTQENGKSVSLKGNLEVKAGMGIGAVEGKEPFEYKNSNVFEATFGGSILGNVSFMPSDICDKNGVALGCGAASKFSDLVSKLVFTSGGIDGKLVSAAGENTLIFEQNGYITGNIEVDQYNRNNTGANAQNRIVFAGGSAKIGDTTASDVVIKNGNVGWGNTQRGSNTIVVHSGVNSTDFKIGSLSVSGDYSDLYMSTVPFTFETLSINNTSSSNKISIENISSGWGSIIIGKDITTYNTSSETLSYVSNFFDTSNAEGVQLKSNIATEFMKNTYSANGTFTINGGITASQSGLNLININGITTIKGNILSTTRGNNQAVNHNNILVFSGTSTTLGEDSGNKISIKIMNSVSGREGLGNYSTNTLILGATTNTLNLSELSVVGDWNAKFDPSARNLNILSLNSASDQGVKNIDTVISNRGNNIIGRDVVTQDNGYSSLLFNNGGTNTEIKNDFATEFMKADYTASGTLQIGSITAGNGGNYINVGQITVTNSLTANSGSNYLIANSFNIKAILADTGSSSENVIIHSGSSANLTSEKGIYAHWGSSQNTINLGAGTLTISDGSIMSKDGTNNITVGTLNITGGTQTVISGHSSEGNAIYAKGGTNNITASGATNTISGAIVASGGTNNLKLSGTTNNEIKGNITANGGTNTIDVTGQKLTLGTSQTKIQITAGTGGGNSTNTIKADSIEAHISTLQAGGHNNPQHKNTITANSGTISIDTIQTQKGVNYKHTNSVTLTSGTLTIGAISNSSSGVANISFGQTGIVNGNISGGTNNFTLTSGTATLTLKGKTSGGTTHQITALNANESKSGTNKLTLDNSAVSSGTMSTTINTITNGENLTVELKGASSKATRLQINNATQLKAIELGTNSTNNTVAFRSGENSINSTVSVSDGQALTIELSSGNAVALDLKEGYSKTGTGEANLRVKGSNTSATITGGTINISNLNFKDSNTNTTLSVHNAQSTFANASGTGTLSLDGKGAGNKVEVTIENKIDNGTNNLTANFNGSDEGENVLNLNNGGTLKAVTLSDNSTNNTLNIKGSTNKTTTIQDAVKVGLGSGITFNLANGTELALSGGSDARLDLAESKGNITVELASGATSAKLSGGGVDETKAINITNLNFAGNSQTLTVENTSVSFGEVNGQNTGSSLTLDASANAVSATLHTIKGENLQVNLSGGADTTKVATLNLNGGTLKTLNISNGNETANITNFKSNTTTITDKINIADSKGLTINLNGGSLYAKGGIATNTSGELKITMDGGKLSVGGGASTFTTKSLTANNGAIIDLASVDSAGRPRASQARNKMTIEDYTQGSNATFVLYANGSAKQADQIVFKDSTNGTDKPIATISVVGGNDLFNVGYVEGGNENILVVDTKTNKAQDKVSIQNGVSVIGGIIAETQLVEGVGSDKGNYYIGQVRDLGVKEELQEVASTVLTVNYDLYLANFNSLNKRMGELRENPHSNGVWARVFGGAMSNDFGVGSKTNYITAQGGYDYGISVGENAKNYTGIAIAYGKSWTKSNSEMNANLVNNANTSLSNVDSNMVEVGVYNSYVADSGWYNDTIFKFDYIMSEFSLSNDPAMSKTNNFAMVLSDEFGYRYKFGSEKSWYIDPQVEVAFGYFNQSDFNRAVYDASHNATDLHASQDSILTLRSRAGLSLGKKFNTTKGFASLYVGAFYEYDYIEGGNAGASGRAGGTVTQLDKIESNGRAIVNVGSNIGLTESARLYIDVEKSFGDKQRTFMQFNLGARYSF